MKIDGEVFEDILENSTNGIIVTDKRLSIKFINITAGKILGVSVEDIKSKPLKGILDLNDFRTVLKTGEKQISQKTEYKNKKLIVDILPVIKKEKISGAVAIFQDITKYENIVDELNNFKELNMMLKAIINNSYDGIYVTDGDANTIQINDAYERITGLKAQDIIGKNMNELVNKGYFSESASLLVIKRNKTVTIRQKLKTGKEILVTGTPVYDSNGKRIFIVTNVRDISDLVRLQNELSQEKELNERYRIEMEIIREKLMETSDFIIKDKSMVNLIETVLRVSKVNTTVLISGETGVGKGDIARIIHENSSRNMERFVEVNCGAIPTTLIESELFGYEKGAFTGASNSGKPGLFQLANNGTIFLDEISELPLDMQVKLLKVLQDRTIFRIGGQNSIKVNIRVIAATNRNLKELVDNGQFREDLYYRLNVVPIIVPPLRNRRDDIPPLTKCFLDEFNKKYNMNKYITHDCLDKIIQYNWPGNIRELRNLIERLVVTTPENEIGKNMLPLNIYNAGKIKNDSWNEYSHMSLKEAREKFEKKLIEEAINKYGSARQAAKILGVNPSTITRKVNN